MRRWNGVTQSEDEVRAYFQTATIESALDTFGYMRRHYEIAGKVLDDRIQKERNIEACANCGKRFSESLPWYNRDPIKDPATGIITNVFSCCQACMIAIKGRQSTGLRKF